MDEKKLLNSLGDENVRVRLGAVYELQRHGGEHLAEALMELCASSDFKVRESAAAVLGFMEIEEPARLRRVTVFLIDLAAGDRSRRVRCSAISGLGGRYAKSPSMRRVIFPALAEAASDANASIRFAAACALGSVRSKKAAPLVERLLHDADRDVRNWSAFYLQLTGLDSEGIRGALMAMLDDEFAEARREAIYTLSKWKDPRMIPVVKAELESDEVIFGMMEAAADLGDPCFLPLLKELVACFKGHGDRWEKEAREQYKRLQRKNRR